MGKAIRRVRGESQKNIIRLLDGISGRYSKWEAWQDFVIMSAISLANTADGPYREEREKAYLERARKYSKRELAAFSEMLAEIVMDMERNPDQDFLGELFMALDLGNEWKGQFFTPYDVCRMMVSMTYGPDMQHRVDRDGWISVNDPACGAGALLIAFANECQRRGINYQTSVLFVAQDVDFLAGCMCYIQLSLMGCPGYVVIDNTLTHPSTCYDKRGLLPHGGSNVWYTPMYFRDIWHYRRIWAKMDALFQSAAIPPDAASKEAVAPGPVVNKQKKQPEKIEFSATETGQLTLF